MNSLEANTRDNITKGQLNAIRNNGNVPAIIYGGKDQNQKISISKKLLKFLIDKENFLSSIITLNVDGKSPTTLQGCAKLLNPTQSQISGTMSIEGIQKLIRRNLALLPHILTTTVIS